MKPIIFMLAVATALIWGVLAYSIENNISVSWTPNPGIRCTRQRWLHDFQLLGRPVRLVVWGNCQ